MKCIPGVLIGLLLLLPAGAKQASGGEHPGILAKDADCSSCHADKTRGKSVHSAMAMPCIVCHLAKTQGDMTTLNLAMPKEQICFACHQTSSELQKHSPVVKGQCVDCHDAHRSSRRWLLREQAEYRPGSSGSRPPPRKTRGERGRSLAVIINR
jgi:predicted CXXCH cytochrome family protein